MNRELNINTGLPALGMTAGGLLNRLSRFLVDPFNDSLDREPRINDPTVDQPCAVLVLDASPSMLDDDWKPTRLEAAKEAAKAYVTRLFREAPDAMVAVVAYHKKARTVCNLMSVREYELIHDLIGWIQTDFYTNITAGLQHAFRNLKGANGKNQVILLTDGGHNSGRPPHRIAECLREIATLETIGIGGTPSDVSEELLKAISSSNPDGSKRYRWIGDKERLVREFTQLAGRLVRS